MLGHSRATTGIVSASTRKEASTNGSAEVSQLRMDWSGLKNWLKVIGSTENSGNGAWVWAKA
jgi:hypothetical protein